MSCSRSLASRTAGSLADRAGRRAIFTGGLVMFTGDVRHLVGAARPGVRRSRARHRVRVFGATTGFAVAVGPLLGGVLTSGWSWRAIFLVNVPVGVAAIVTTLTRLAESRGPRPGRLDWTGFLTFSGALVALGFALIRGNAEGWTSAGIIACLAGAVVLLAGFVAIERQRAEPMLDLPRPRPAAFTSAFNDVFLVGALVAVAGALATLLLMAAATSPSPRPNPPPSPA